MAAKIDIDKPRPMPISKRTVAIMPEKIALCERETERTEERDGEGRG